MKPSDPASPPGRRPLSFLRRMKQVFKRYAARHLVLSGAQEDLTRATGGAVPGEITRLELCDDRLLVEGWVQAGAGVTRLAVVLLRDQYETLPDAPVPGEDRAEARAGFAFDLPFAPGTFTLEIQTAETVFRVPVRGIAAGRLRWAMWALWPRFLWALVLVLPAIWRWKMRGDQGAREAVKDRLGFSAHVPALPLDGAFFAELETVSVSVQGDVPATGVTIILPVYNAFEVLQETLRRVVAHTDLPWRLIVIEDCSSDLKVRPFLRDWVAGVNGAPDRPDREKGVVELIENAENLGFIGAVNRGFERALEQDGDAPVILLNSDALVPTGWASRLVHPMRVARDVASVTPMSNDAEIFSVPVMCRATDLAPGEGDRIDAFARRFAGQGADLARGVSEAPTGVGFCMAMNRTYLRQIPRFDMGFGRGYGEETDWCQRVRALGGRHVGLSGLFVEHRGAGSFGSEEKLRLVASSAAIIAGRYPKYDQEVQTFLRRDPMVTARLALAIAWAAERQSGQSDPVPLYLAHAMGGGAEKYLERRIAQDVAGGGGALVLRVGQTRRWRLELHTAQGVTQGLCEDFTLIQQLLEPLSARRVVYSCGVGDRDPVELPGILQQLAQGPEDRIEVLIHDYFPISPSHTLLGADGVYRGVPDLATDDPAHQVPRPGAAPGPHAAWRATWGDLMVVADEITVFSESSRDLMAEAYPAAAGAIRIRPHDQLADIPAVALPARTARPVIGVLGNVGYQKGAGVLVDLGQLLARDPCAGLVVIGNLDPGYRLPAPGIVHGSYRHADIPGLVARYGITCWLIPSVWPETFSFATREALATGLPVWCFDLGAQAEAVRAAQEGGLGGRRGGVIPLTEGRADPARVLAQVVQGQSGSNRS